MINNALPIAISIELLNIHKKMFSKPETGFIQVCS